MPLAIAGRSGRTNGRSHSKDVFESVPWREHRCSAGICRPYDHETECVALKGDVLNLGVMCCPALFVCLKKLEDGVF